MSSPLVERGTPHYVLMDHKERIGPKVGLLHDGGSCLAIYGFSDKQPYEAFCKNSSLALTPYPLVKFYLQNQVDEGEQRFKLVILDAIDPNADTLYAATMHDALEAHIHGRKTVPVSYQLDFDKAKSEYRVLESTLVA